jgi:hypothetical protein
MQSVVMDDDAEADLTEAEIDLMLAAAEPVEVVGPDAWVGRSSEDAAVRSPIAGAALVPRETGGPI